jgi:hypothetical protein
MQAVAAAHQRGVQGNDVEERAKSELLLKQPARGTQLRKPEARVEEQLARVVAGLSMDVDRARVIRRVAVVGPEGVREPSVGVRERDQLAAAFVVEAKISALLACCHTRDTRVGFDESPYPGKVRHVAYIDMSHLVVTDRKGAAGKRVERLTKRPLARRQ